MAPDLSLVVPTYNTEALTMQCIRSIKATDDGLHCEIIVVDDASSDGTVEAISKEWPDVIVIRNMRNLGYGGAANEGLRRAAGRFLAVVNSDTEVQAGAMRLLVEYLESHRSVGVVAPMLVNSDGSLQKSVSRHPTVVANVARLILPIGIFESSLVRFAVRHLSKWFNFGRISPAPAAPAVVECVMGAFFVMPRAVFEKVGGFDAERFYLFVEEADLFLRIQRSGWAVCYVPSARVTHHGSRTVGRFRHRYVIQQYKSFFAFYEAHFKPRVLIAYRIAMSLIFGAKAGILAACGLWPWGDRTERLRRAETFVSIVRLMHSRSFRSRNVMRDVPFRYIEPPQRES